MPPHNVPTKVNGINIRNLFQHPQSSETDYPETPLTAIFPTERMHMNVTEGTIVLQNGP